MLWMPWVKQGINNIWAVPPRRGVIPGRLKPAGWLLDEDGCLKEIYGGPVKASEPVLLLPAGREKKELSFAGGLRPGGAPRLRGVLHYFTRGPTAGAWVV